MTATSMDIRTNAVHVQRNRVAADVISVKPIPSMHTCSRNAGRANELNRMHGALRKLGIF